MQAEMTDQGMPVYAAPKKRSWVKSAFYLIAILFLAALGYYSYANGYFKAAGDKASELFAALPWNKQAETATATDAQPASAEATKVAALPEEVLSKARGAFATGDVNAAIQAYNEVIAKHPNDIGARGELGNVFYTVGMMREAAQAYFDAASNAIDQKQFDVAEELLPVIIDGNPMLATQLSDKLFEARIKDDEARHAEQVKADDARYAAERAQFQQSYQAPQQQAQQPQEMQASPYQYEPFPADRYAPPQYQPYQPQR